MKATFQPPAGNDARRVAHTIDSDSEPASGGSGDDGAVTPEYLPPCSTCGRAILFSSRCAFCAVSPAEGSLVGDDTFGATDDNKHFEKVLQHAPVTVKGRSQSDVRASHLDKARSLSASANASTLDAMRSKAAAREALESETHNIQQVPTAVADTEVHLIESPARGSRAAPATLAPGNCSPLREAITGQPLPRDAILQQAGRGQEQVDFPEGVGDPPQE